MPESRVGSPRVITDRGEPAYVPLSIEDYRRLSEPEVPLVDRLSMDDDLDIEFESARIELRAFDL
ncbi:type II toxin-antitoxin system prevent-host-death family antitoxin [Gordonia malaquae]|uniref:type II toxin-antitoxin system prevent-host-death family antitoxin n=1 Tax=Gordonia malaquae TaxID=410332 RepID=UPI0030C785A0